MRILRRIDWSFILIVLLVLATYWFLSDARWPDNADLVKVMSLTCIQFPKSARLLHANYIDSDCSCEVKCIRAKVGIRPADVDPLVKQLRDGMYEVTSTDRLGISDKIREKPSCQGQSQLRHTWRLPGWWRPDSARKFVAARQLCREYDLHVLIDMDDLKQGVVYVNYMEHW